MVLRYSDIESHAFTMYAFIGYVTIDFEMKLGTTDGYFAVPSHWVFREELVGQWVLELQWEGSERQETLGTLVKKSVPGQSGVVTFTWNPGPKVAGKKPKMWVNNHRGWESGVVWKGRISS
jgi:hypothetical protein